MSATKPAPKRRPRRAKLVPLFLLGSDGETYACASVDNLPEGILNNPNTVVAIRLNRRERDVALDALQVGVVEASKTLQGIVGRKFDA